jgi:hypothetical protein
MGGWWALPCYAMLLHPHRICIICLHCTALEIKMKCPFMLFRDETPKFKIQNLMLC